MNIGEAIKTIRKSKNLSQKELANLSGLSPNAICQIEKDNVFPGKQTIQDISKALKVPVSYILFFSIEENDVPKIKRSSFNILYKSMKDYLIS